MERPDLKLVTAAGPTVRGAGASLWGVLVLSAAGFATLSGADAGRRPFDPAPLAESALASTLLTDDPRPADEARERLRARLRRTPLDGASRTIAASLLAELAASPADRAEAAGQAEAAIRATPVDGHVAHGAARVLARCDRSDLALATIAHIFDYAPDEAAAALADIEPFVARDQLETGLRETPRAWLAWASKLRSQGRAADADARLDALLARWPGDLPALRLAASAAASRDRLDDLARLVPPSLALPETAQAAPLFAFRSRTKAAAGDPAGSHADALRAVALSNGDPWVLTLAGDAVAAAEPGLARDYWRRALYRLGAKPSNTDASVWVRYRLARLDDREGRAGDALREWRTILAARPDDAEAKRRVAELTGESAR